MIEVGVLLSVGAIALPLALAMALCVRIVRPIALHLAPWATLPALALAFGPQGSIAVHADTMLLGTTIGLGDEVTRTFLVLTATVWFASGLFARGYMASDPRRARFWMFFLLSATGNVGLVLAQDVASFYLFYALMTFAAYGLVVHVQTAEARRAGSVYLVMGLLGEVLLLAAFVLLVGVEVNLPLHEAPRAVAVSPHRGLVIGLLLAGFGIKVGVLVLHVWLPLAHPVAPTPASAVLSGAMIKAGVLGWLRFLPLGISAQPDAGLICLVAGFAAAFYAVAVGLTQRDPKTILAYSSVSQMGFVTAAVGVALVEPATAPVAVVAILFYALHHALAKAALFLGTGVVSAARAGWARTLVMIGLLVSALDLAGAPLSSGALAKISFKHVFVEKEAALGALLSAGAVGSALLMAKFMAVVARRHEPVASRRGPWLPWLLLLVLDIVFLMRPPIEREELDLLVDPANVASAAWPIVVAITLAVTAHWALQRRRSLRGLRVPPGDLLVVLELAQDRLRPRVAASVLAATRMEARLQAWVSRRASVEQHWEAMVRVSTRIEQRLSTSALIGAALFVLGIVLAWTAR